MKKTPIEKWELFCPECSGSGTINVSTRYKEFNSWPMICFVCGGEKVFTWIDLIKKNIKEYSSGYIHLGCLEKLSRGNWSYILGR